MYVVKRPFRDASGMFTAGTIVNPEVVKGFRYRVRESHLVEVTEKNFDEYADYFLQKYGVILGKEGETEEVPEAVEETVEVVTEEPITEAAKEVHTQAAKVVAKAVAK